MADTVRTDATNLTNLADNTSGDISPQDMRDVYVSLQVPEWVRYTDHRMSDETGHTDDDFFNADSSGDYTTQTVSGSATWTIDRGKLGVKAVSQSADDLSAYLKSITSASAPMTIEARMTHMTSYGQYPMAGIAFTDGTATSSNVVLVHVQGDSTQAAPDVIMDSGTLTDFNADATDVVKQRIATGFGVYYFRLVWVSANTWDAAVSFDGVVWDTESVNLSKTMTPTHFGFVASSDTSGISSQASYDYLRVYDSDLSV